MITFLSRSILLLFAVNLGIAFGAGLYEARITVPQWLEFSSDGGYRWNAEAARRANAGLRFWVYVTTIPLTLLTLGSLLVAWRAPIEVRGWWLAAGIAALVDRILTFAYFIPTMLTLMNDLTMSDSQAVAKATQWVNLGFVRHAATLASWLLALKAFSILSKLG
jgi:hypothetical protein